MEENKQPRGPNWSSSEKLELHKAFLENQAIIDGAFTAELTQKHKDAAWLNVSQRVNAQSTTKRSLRKIKKKLSDNKVSVRRKERGRQASMKRTGGGEAPPKLESWEEELLDVIPNSSVNGFKGVDTFDQFDAVKVAATITKRMGPSGDATATPRIARTATTSTKTTMFSNSNNPATLSSTTTATAASTSEIEHDQQLGTVGSLPKVPIFIRETACRSGQPAAAAFKVTEAADAGTRGRKRKSVDEERSDVINLLQQQNNLLQEILNEAKKTTDIISKLFPVQLSYP